DEAALPLQLIVVCGRNERARRRLSATPLQTPTRVFGFVTNMPDLVSAADVVVTKGGPQSIMECLTAGRPVIVTDVLPGQERGNDRYVERHGAGYAARKPDRIIGHLQRLATDPIERARVADGARRLGQPHAADAVAQVIESTWRHRTSVAR
ncbi:MAG: glycosyltransferase, partial [Dehalococcoidia bacterium]|nr:glycosyltransferase [Dehalococcoidia bacterium]